MGSQIRAADIKRIHYGYIVAPSGTPDAGQPIPVCGYVVQHPQFAAAAFSERLASNGLDQVGNYPDWMPRFRSLRVERALFAHDLLVYERDGAELGEPQLAQE